MATYTKMLVVLVSCKHPSSVFLFIVSWSFGRMFFTPTRSCLLLIHSTPHSFPLSLALPPSLVHFLFSSRFWPFSHCQSTISLISVPSPSDCIYWPTILLLTAIPFLRSPLKIYFIQIFRLSAQFQPHFRLFAVYWGKRAACCLYITIKMSLTVPNTLCR